MLTVLMILLLVYVYCTFKSIKYYSANHKTMTSPRKMIVANIAFISLIFVGSFVVELIINQPRDSLLSNMWQVVGLLNSLTFIHIIETFKGNPVNGRDYKESN